MPDSPPVQLNRVPFPEKLTFDAVSDRASEWKLFRQIWDNYEISSQLDKCDSKMRTATLLTCFSPSALKVFNAIKFEQASDKQDIDKVLQMMEKACKGVVNEIYERFLFNTRTQKSGETVSEFYGELASIADNCNYGELKSSLLRDRMVVGILDESTRKRLLMEKDLTLEKTLDIARSIEATKLQTQQINGSAELSYVKQKTSQPKGMSSSEQSSIPTCSFCGYSPPHNRKQCPARNATCTRCSKRGHFQKACKARNLNVLAESEESLEPQLHHDSYFLGVVEESNGRPKGEVTLNMNGRTINFCIDTGADVNVIPRSIYNRHFSSYSLAPCKSTIKGANQQTLTVDGIFSCFVSYKGKNYDLKFYVLPTSKALLSRDSSLHLGAVKFIQNISQYENKLFNGLGQMPTPYSIQLTDNATPFAVQSPRRVSLPLMNKVQNELNRLEEQGVIRKITTPTDWVAPMVVVPKKDKDTVRICVDFTALNKAVKRERHILPSVDHTLGQMAGATVFTKLDANSGFHQVKLTEECQHLTTFITPQGRYCYKRMPFGISSGPEHFQRQIHQILEGLSGVTCLMDDIVVYGRTLEEHDKRLELVFKRLSETGLTLNKSKCQIGVSEISFLGHVIKSGSVSADDKKKEAVKNFPTPSSVPELRRFLGMVNQLAKFIPDLATITAPLRSLLNKDNAWHWDDTQNRAINRIREILCSDIVLTLYNPNNPTRVSADSSGYGLGAVLLQQTDGVWRPVAYASRSLSETEKRYAQVEKEALACAWALDKFQDYLIGIQFSVESDHKPLLALLGTKALSELPPRIQRIRMRMMRFCYDMVYTPGKELHVADTLSRAPIHMPTKNDAILQDEITSFVHMITSHLPASDEKLKEIRSQQSQDEACSLLIGYCQDKWPKETSPVVQAYWPHRANISYNKGLLMYDARIIIPPSMQQEILEKLHVGHQGITKCRRRAQESVWWPGLSTQIQKLVSSCHICTQKNAQNVEPLKPTDFPAHPWQHIATDLMMFRNKQYLVVVDYFSRYIEMALLNSTTSTSIITHLKSFFSRHGIPMSLMSDNGPQYASKEFAAFAKNWGFIHRTCSPHHQSANGAAERAVGTLKNLLVESKDPYMSLLVYRSTPLENGMSPAELLMNRRIRSNLPMSYDHLPDHTCVTRDSIAHFETQKKEKQKQCFDDRHKARPLSELSPGDVVFMTDLKQRAVVDKKLSERTYVVRTDQASFRRNRFHLKKLLGTVETGRSGLKNSDDDNFIYADPPQGSDAPVKPVPTRIRSRPVNLPTRFKDYVMSGL